MDISVVIPTFNRKEVLIRAIDSVLRQSYLPKEIIVVDDGSDDGTIEVLWEWILDPRVKPEDDGKFKPEDDGKFKPEDDDPSVIPNLIGNLTHSALEQNASYSVIPNSIGNLVHIVTINNISIKYIYQPNKGVSSARNLGIKKASCEWIAFLDSDDEWDANKLQEQVLFHHHNSDILMSYTAEKWIRNAVEVKVPKKFRKVGGEIFENCLSHCIIAPSATLIHQELLDAVGVFDEELEVCEDYDLWLRVARKYEIGLVDKPLIIKYGGADDQLSMKFWGMDRFRVVSLENLLKSKDEKGGLIVDMLIKKYRVLLKGALKHSRVLDIENYKRKLQVLGD